MSKQIMAGIEGEEKVRDALRVMLGTKIAGFFRTTNLICAGRQVQIDFLVLVPGVGLVVLEVKNWKGKIRVSADEKWEREVPSYINKFPNASLQALRASGILLQLLEQERVNKWPIRSLVVFLQEDSQVIIAAGGDAPQTDIVKLSGFSEWLVRAIENKWLVNDFSRNDFERIKSMFAKYAVPYEDVRVNIGAGETIL
jgi:hypothetical protein